MEGIQMSLVEYLCDTLSCANQFLPSFSHSLQTAWKCYKYFHIHNIMAMHITLPPYVNLSRYKKKQYYTGNKLLEIFHITLKFESYNTQANIKSIYYPTQYTLFNVLHFNCF